MAAAIYILYMYVAKEFPTAFTAIKGDVTLTVFNLLLSRHY